MKLHLTTLRKKSNKPAHLYHNSSVPQLKGQIVADFPRCESYRSDFPTTLARTIVHLPSKPSKTPTLKKVEFDPKMTPSCLKSPKSSEKLAGISLSPGEIEYSEFVSPRAEKTIQRRNLTARNYTASTKVRRNGSYSGTFPAVHLSTFSDFHSPTKPAQKATAVPLKAQKPLFAPPSASSSNPIRQFFYRAPPTGPNSIYYSKPDQPKPSTANIQLVARKLL